MMALWRLGSAGNPSSSCTLQQQHYSPFQKHYIGTPRSYFHRMLTGPFCSNWQSSSMPLVRIIQQHASRVLLPQVAAAAAFSTQVSW
jgi:hypothetical protein